MDNLYEIVVTAIVEKDDHMLVTRRAASKKRWPGMWTVPGGKFERSDYITYPKDTVNAWYSILERTVRREVKEEVGLDIKNIEYLTSMIAEYPDGRHSLIISLVAKYAGGEIKLQEEELDEARWVTLEEANELPFIDGIYDELIMADEKRRGLHHEWQRSVQ